MSDCILCKIASKEIPNYTVYEDDQTIAFLDINPTTKGHTVVIPKQHTPFLTGLDPALYAPLLASVNQSMRRIAHILHPDGFNVGWNHGPAGGQAVPHLHIHIFPRWLNDGGGSVHSIVKGKGEMNVGEVAELFKQT